MTTAEEMNFKITRRVYKNILFKKAERVKVRVYRDPVRDARCYQLAAHRDGYWDYHTFYEETT